MCAAPTRAAFDALTAPWEPAHQALYVPNATYRPRLNVSLRSWRDRFHYLPRALTFALAPRPSCAARARVGPRPRRHDRPRRRRQPRGRLALRVLQTGGGGGGGGRRRRRGRAAAGGREIVRREEARFLADVDGARAAGDPRGDGAVVA